MFLGKKRKFKIRKFQRPKKLREIVRTPHFFDRIPAPTSDSASASETPENYGDILNYPSPITSLGSHPNVPNTVYVASFRGGIERIKWTISKEQPQIISKHEDFERSFHSLSFRDDGKVLLSSTNDGHIYLFGSESKVFKTPLKKINSGKKIAIRLVRFLSSPDLVVSGDDSGGVNIFNILREKSIFTDTFNDYVRAGARFSSTEFIIGSYDNTCKIYDTRVNKNNSIVSYMKLSNPIENIIYDINDNTVILSETGGLLKIFDKRRVVSNSLLLDTAKPTEMNCLSHKVLHRKTIMDLRSVNDSNYFISSSLDGSVKIFSINVKKSPPKMIKVHKTFVFQKPVLQATVIGLSSELDLISQSTMKEKLILANNNKQVTIIEAFGKESGILKKGKFLKMHRDEELLMTKNYQNLISSHLINQVNRMNNQKLINQTRIMERYKKNFAQFEYKWIFLDSIIKFKKNPIICFSVIQELKNRNELLNALDNRNDVQLKLILEFCERWIVDERFTAVVLKDLITPILRYYSEIIGKSQKVDEVLMRISKIMKEMVEGMCKLQKAKGMIDLIILNSL